MIEELQSVIDDHVNCVEDIDLMTILDISNMIYRSIMNGGKILICGCGGSAADAQHFAAEFIWRFENKDRRPLPAIALTTDSSIITAIANDDSFSCVFSNQIFVLGHPNDIVILITTSGKSKSIIMAQQMAKAMEIKTIVLTGMGGESFLQTCEYGIAVSSTNTARIQEAHGLIIHMICSILDKKNWNNS